MTNDGWQREILAAMERLVGAEQVAETAARWAEHAARDKVEITFLGPYSSGKSSLLRRLVVDSGAPTPEWLTISARRETFELNAIDVGDLTFTDAPGFAAGNDLHDELAQDALALSDVFLLVVPPQLLTTNREFLGSVLSGRYFFDGPRPGVDSTVIAVIAQADSMGIDPEDDVEGMRRLAERKKQELISQLEDAAGVSLPGLQVFCVAADPYEEQARQPQPQRSAFDPYRAWDGVDALTAALATLPHRFSDLRSSAAERYYCSVAGTLVSQANEVLEELRASVDELVARQTEWDLLKERVDAVVDDARGDLRTALVVLADELSYELGTNQQESRAEFDKRLVATIDQWQQRWDGEIDLVIGEGQVQVDDRLARPRARRTETFLQSLAARATTGDAVQPNSRIVNLLSDNMGELQGLARQAFEVYTGKSLDKLLADGRKARSTMETAARLTKAEEDAAKSVKAAVVLDASVQIAAGVMSIVVVVDAQRRQQALDEQRRRERDEAREAIERNAVTLSDELVNGAGDEPGWRSRADAALEGLRDQLGIAEGAAPSNDLQQALANHQQAVAELHALIAGAPR